MKRFKQFKISLLTGLIIGLLIFYVQPASADTVCNLIINGQQVQTESRLINNCIYFPVRDVVKPLGVTNNIIWDNDNQTVTITKNYKTITMKVGSNIFTDNGIQTIMKNPPLIIEGRLFVPISYMVKAFNYTINFNEDYNTIFLTMNPEIQEFLKYDNKVNVLLKDIDGLLRKETISETEHKTLKTKIYLTIDELKSWGELYYYSDVKNLYIRCLAYGDLSCQYKEAINNPANNIIKSWCENEYKKYLDGYNDSRLQLQAEISRLQKENHM
jgi:hypothetical protein